MPTPAKSLFRPEALRNRLKLFAVPPPVSAARSRLGDSARLLASKEGEAMKETELLGDFIRDVFGDVLGYAGPASGADPYTLKREKTIEVDGKFADAVLGRFGATSGQAQFLAVLEGKGPRDPLDRPFAGRKLSAVDQALRYAVNLVCDWYLVTNLRETRLYHKGHDQLTYERFETRTLAEDDAAFRRFVFLLGAERVTPPAGGCHLDDLLSESHRIGLELTRDYYREYAALRRKTFETLCRHNPTVPASDVLAATEKALDRVLFIAFCEDRGLLPAEIVDRAYRNADPFNPRPIWENFKGLFRAVDAGNRQLGIERYNGGLFAPDPLLDGGLTVPDEVCRGFQRLAEYDYGSPAVEGEGRLIDVEILGHIFEQSISDLEEMRAALETSPLAPVLRGEGSGVRGSSLPKTDPLTPDPSPRSTGARGGVGPSRRKREGAFYTPPFITRYIVAATLGPVLQERFEALRRIHHGETAATARKVLADPSAYDLAALRPAQKTALVSFWDAWLDELASLRIVDPACGSGAFLIEAFEQLAAANAQAVARLTELQMGGRTLFDIDKRILQNNLYGVDLNGEAVDICRLSLWIKTAQLGKELTSLDHNIRAGNSVIADPAIHPRAFDWRAAFPEVFAAGGFDAVISNPPYVRQEWIAEFKPYLQQHYRAYDGTADLYVYFYELGINLLRPGGRLGFIVTNKWMRAGYGEPLRRLFGESAWVESVVDFGHAKQIFEDADVFPSILVARKPAAGPAPPTARVCAIPREQLRIDDLSRQIAAEGFEVPRERLGAEAWTLEPPGVVALMEKIRLKGVPLKEFAGTGPYRGILTGFNDAFIVDTPTRDRLVREHPSSEAILKKFLRGQDVDRWCAEWSGQWMIFARRGTDIDQTPAVKRHLEAHRTGLEPKPKDWAGKEWPGRKPGSYKWYELQDPIEYWAEFDKPKIIYQVIRFYPCYAFDTTRMLGNDKTFILPTADLYLLGVLNSPLMWWRNWRALTHLKDEALSPMGFMMESLPVAVPSDNLRGEVEKAVQRLLAITAEQHAGRRAVLDWLKVEFAIDKPDLKLQAVAALDADSLAAEVKKVRGKKKPLSVAQVEALKDEHARSVLPLQTLAGEARQCERRLAELVNTAYGLTPEEVALMWQTAPPRMPK